MRGKSPEGVGDVLRIESRRLRAGSLNFMRLRKRGRGPKGFSTFF
jgi:hypothetical protein